MDRESFATVAEAWGALEEQRGMSDGEAVDLWTHQLQAAALLRREGADDGLVVAGLLHDLGDGRVPEHTHGPWAAALVRPLLGERVAWLIAAHADAKRYLCLIDPVYHASLSPVSRETLRHQGGPMTPAEASAFAAHPWASDALRLRRCDDGAKDPSVVIEDPLSFRAVLERVAAARRPA